MFQFTSWPFLFLLLPALLLILVRRKRRFGPSARFSFPPGATMPAPSFALRWAWLPYFLKTAALCLCILAMARPQWLHRRTVLPYSGINIVLALDISESMAAVDFEYDGKAVDRLEAVKGVVERFIDQRYGDRIGLVVFGSNAYTQTPLTQDYRTLSLALGHLKIGAAGRQTALGDAVGISLKRLEDVESRSNVIILLTDGESNAGDLAPPAATEIAAGRGVKIYTVGVGRQGRAPFVIDHPIYGRRTVFRQVGMDEETLRRIADRTGGLFFKAEDTRGLEETYAAIDRLEKTEVDREAFFERTDLYPWFLFPALAALALSVLLANTRLLRVP